jgi:hypothetical protein
VTDLTLLLFDVDGVLLYPRAYRYAFQRTLDYFAEAMGQPPAAITYDEIATFEACGITNEWDGVPMCVGAMLRVLLGARPDLARPTFAGTLEALRKAGVTAERPDFAALARAVRDATPSDEAPTETIIRLLEETGSPVLGPLLVEMFDNHYSPEAPVTYIYQHFVLGDKHFAATYGMQTAFAAESALLTQDQALLDDARREHLLDLLADPTWGAAVFTARPSLPPQGAPLGDADPLTFPPEGDLAVERIGLDGRLTVIAGGRLTWLAARHGKGAAAYIKPSPVHALAAIGAASGGEEVASLEAAATLYEEGRLSGPLAELAGRQIEVIVFEDGMGGIHATHRAGELLREAGIDVQTRAIGVTIDPTKREALVPITERIVGDINTALTPFLEG